MTSWRVSGALLALLAVFHPARADDSAALVHQALYAGNLAEGRKTLEARLAAEPRDDVARLGLGLVQWSQGLERVTQALYRYGAGPDSALGMVAGPLMAVRSNNPQPAPCAYEDTVKIVADLLADLTAADATLAQIESPDVKLVFDAARIRLDFDGDGQSGEDETLGAMAAAGMRVVAPPESQPAAEVGFDRADVEWLRAYGHVLMALCEMRLAYDARELFERAGHLAFPNNVTPYGFLKKKVAGDMGFITDITDMIAAVHLLNFPLKDKARMAAALAHWQAMVKHSRALWKFAEQETDNDREWIPNPRQQSVLPEGVISAEMIVAWQEFLTEAEDLLAGRKLVPFWRDSDGQGVNLYKAFSEPRDLDVVLWVQGTGAAPYLETGPVTRAETWQRFQQVFQGNFIGFAIWIN